MPDDIIAVTDAGIGYGNKLVFDGLNLDIPARKVTALCGPNGCGKSTALKAMRGLLPLTAGQVLIEGAAIGGWAPRDLARKLAMLGQNPTAPDEMLVRDLVALGRYAHRRAFSGLSRTDREAIDDALGSTGLTELADRPIGTLSGGQLQRGWLAMVIAQATPAIFLDEPTNHLDVSHAYAMLSHVRRLVAEDGKTIVVVLHDLNMAARFADHVVLFKQGAVVAEGDVHATMTPRTLSDVFEIDCHVMKVPDGDLPLIVPTPR